MYAYNPKGRKNKFFECLELPNGCVEITEEEYINKKLDSEESEISSDGMKGFSFEGRKETGEKSWSILKDGSASFKSIDATDKMTAPTIENTADNSTNAATTRFVQAVIKAFKAASNLWTGQQIIKVTGGQNVLELANDVDSKFQFYPTSGNEQSTGTLRYLDAAKKLADLTFKEGMIRYATSNGSDKTELANKEYVDSKTSSGNWIDKTSSRTVNVVYQNTTGKDIHVAVMFNWNDKGGGEALRTASTSTSVTQDSSVISTYNCNERIGGTVYGAIPDKYFYTVTKGADNYVRWKELTTSVSMEIKHLISNKTKQVFAFDGNQNSLYDAYLKNKDEVFIPCRLPNDFEVWDSTKKDWVLDTNARDNHIISEIKYKLESLISKYQVYTISFTFDDLPKAEQELLIAFLKECRNLLKEVTVDTKVPDIPNFLKETEPLENI